MGRKETSQRVLDRFARALLETPRKTLLEESHREELSLQAWKQASQILDQWGVEKVIPQGTVPGIPGIIVVSHRSDRYKRVEYLETPPVEIADVTIFLVREVGPQESLSSIDLMCHRNKDIISVSLCSITKDSARNNTQGNLKSKRQFASLFNLLNLLSEEYQEQNIPPQRDPRVSSRP